MKNKLFMLIVLISVLPLTADTIWQDRNVYTSETMNNGDAVIVEIEDISRLRFSVSLENKSNSSVSSEPDIEITAFLPKVSAKKNVDNNDVVKLDGRTNLRLKVTALVTGPSGQGNYNINGYKEYVFNGVLTRFTVTGVVNPQMLSGRTIKSENIINFRLSIIGVRNGLNLNLQRDAIEEGESANADLTEEEKQTIIIDYLTKIINEISR